jgi:hypothetical protein
LELALGAPHRVTVTHWSDHGWLEALSEYVGLPELPPRLLASKALKPSPATPETEAIDAFRGTHRVTVSPSRWSIVLEAVPSVPSAA